MLMGNVDVNYLGGTSLLELCNTYELQDECANLVFFPDDEELKNNLNYLLNEAITNNPDPYEAILDGYITQFESRYKVDVEKVITLNVMDDDYIYKFRTMTYSIDIPYIIDGRAPILLNEIALYPEFLEHNDLKLLDEITIEDITYTIVGTFYAPEYMMPIFSSNRVEYDEKIQSLVLMTKETINQNNVPLIVKYNVKGDLSEIFNEFDYEQLFSADFSKLGKEMQLLDIIVPQELNFRVTALKDEVRMANLFIDLFLGVFIVLSGILLVVFMRKYIEKNKRDIKILNSMGYNEKEITLSLLAFPFFVSLMSLLGYVIGLLLSSKLFEIYGSRYYYPKAGFKIEPAVFLMVVVLPMIFILIINFFFIRSKIYPKTKKRNRLKFRLFKYTELKTQVVSLILFLIVSVLIIFGMNSNSLFETFSETTLRGNHFDSYVFLKSFTNEELDEEYEPFTRYKTTITKINGKEPSENIATYLYGINDSNNLKLLIDDDIKNNKLVNDGIIISDYFSESSSIKIGDTLTFNVGGVVISRQVKGVSGELVESYMFMDLKTLNEAFSLDESYYNGVYLTNDNYESDQIVSIVDYESSLNEMVMIFNISSAILRYVTTLSIILGLYVFILIIYSYLDDNMTSIATLKAIGYNNKEIVFKYFIILYIIAILSYLAAIPITSLMLDKFINIIVETIGFKFIVSINALKVLIGFIILNILYGFVVILSVNYFNKVDISLLLKKE